MFFIPLCFYESVTNSAETPSWSSYKKWNETSSADGWILPQSATQVANSWRLMVHVVSTLRRLQSYFQYCGEPAIALHSYTVSLVQWVNPLLPVIRDLGSIPGGYLCETGILLLVLYRYIGDSYVINHCGLNWGGLRPEPSLGRRANNLIIPLDLAQLFCPGFTLAGGPPSGFTTDIVSY